MMQNFNYHSHTYRCGHADLDMQDEEYILEYIKMGFKKIAFTDHCPQKNAIDKRTNMRMDYREREGYLNSIKYLKEKYKDKIVIESGYEVEYLPGEEENLKELKQETNKIILGQHYIYDDNKQLKIWGESNFTDDDLIKYAEYIEKVAQLKLIDIIAHPDTFMLSRDKFGDVEAKAAHIICKAAEEYNVPLEININKIFKKVYLKNRRSNSLTLEEKKERLLSVKYPCKEFWNIAKNYNIRVVYGLDTHHRGQILLWNELIELAKEIIGKETIERLNFIEEDI